MLSKHCPFLLCLFIVLAQTAFSNGRPFPGYYIANNGDSVFCKVEYNDWFRNPSAIVVEENGIRKTLRPTDIKGFGVTGYADYRSAGVTYHLGPVQGFNLPAEYSDSIKTNDCFLLVLVRGPYSLYELKLAERDYFFLSENGGGPIKELVYRVKQYQMRIMEDNEYKTVLANYMIQEHIWNDQDPSAINGLTYNRKKLVALVVQLNEARTGVKASLPAAGRSGEKPVQLEIFGGGVMNLFPSTFSTQYATAKFPSTVSAAGGLGLRVVIPGHFDAFSVGLTLGYSNFQSSTSITGRTKVDVQSDTWYTLVNYTENLTVANSLLTTSLYGMYSLPATGSIRPYGKVGFNLDYLLKPDKNVHSNWSGHDTDYHSYNPPYDDGIRSGTLKAVSMRSLAVCATIAVGIQAGRHRIELAYYTPMQLANPVQATFTLERAAVYYYFTVFR